MKKYIHEKSKPEGRSDEIISKPIISKPRIQCVPPLAKVNIYVVIIIITPSFAGPFLPCSPRRGHHLFLTLLFSRLYPDQPRLIRLWPPFRYVSPKCTCCVDGVEFVHKICGVDVLSNSYWIPYLKSTPSQKMQGLLVYRISSLAGRPSVRQSVRLASMTMTLFVPDGIRPGWCAPKRSRDRLWPPYKAKYEFLRWGAD